MNWLEILFRFFQVKVFVLFNILVVFFFLGGVLIFHFYYPIDNSSVLPSRTTEEAGGVIETIPPTNPTNTIRGQFGT